jgi:hypothetical protein
MIWMWLIFQADQGKFKVPLTEDGMKVLLRQEANDLQAQYIVSQATAHRKKAIMELKSAKAAVQANKALLKSARENRTKSRQTSKVRRK